MSAIRFCLVPLLLVAAGAGCTTSTPPGGDGGTVDASVPDSAIPDSAIPDASPRDSSATDVGPATDGGSSCTGDLDCIDEEMCARGGCVPNSCPGTGGESMGCGERPECGDAIGILIAQCWQCVDPITCERVD